MKKIHHLATGDWEGQSTSSQNGENTIWKQVAITCMPDPRNADVNIVNGYGISLWRNLTIPFELHGYLDRRSRVITFTKAHKGAYTNEVEYVGTIQVDVTGNCIIKGEYKSGTIVLKKEADVNINRILESLSSQEWGGFSKARVGETTRWKNTVINFAPYRDGHHLEGSTLLIFSGKGTSEWNNMLINFDLTGTLDWANMQVIMTKQHRGRYTNSITYTGSLQYADALHFAKSQSSVEGGGGSGTLDGLATECDDFFYQLHGVYDKGEFHLGIKANSLASAMADMSIALPLPLPRSVPTPLSPEGLVVSSRGREVEYGEIVTIMTGVWEGEAIDTSGVKAPFSNTALTFLQSDDKVLFSGEGTSKGAAVTLRGSLHWSSDLNSYVLPCNIQYTNSTTGRVVSSDYNASVNFFSHGPLIVGQSKEKDTTLHLRRMRAFVTSHEIIENICSLTKHPVPASIPLSSALILYLNFLGGVFAGGTILMNHREAISKYRSRMDITDTDHQHVIGLVGISPVEFNVLIRENIGSESPLKEPDEVDICKICYVNKINCVLLPCGHYCICNTCGERCKECPICRVRLKFVQTIYRC